MKGEVYKSPSNMKMQPTTYILNHKQIEDVYKLIASCDRYT